MQTRLALVFALALSIPGQSRAQALPESLPIAAGPQGSINYAIAAGIASVVARHTAMKSIVIPYAGTALSLPMVSQGDPPVSVNDGGSVYQAYVGERQFDRAYPNLRLLSIGSPNNLTTAVKEDSPIRTGADLRGKRVAAKFPALPSCEVHTEALLANFDLGWNDVRPVPVTNIVAAAQALATGQADALVCASPAIAALREVHIRTPLRFISVDPAPAAMERARKIYKYNEKAVLLKQGAMGWLPGDTWLVDFPWYMFSNAAISDDTAYAIVKAIWDYNDELGDIHPILKQWTRAGMATTDATIPFHPGAIRFYKEAGVWSAALDAAQKKTMR